MIPEIPLPDAVTLKELIRKALASEKFSGPEYQWLVNVLVSLEKDAMYQLKQRIKFYEAQELAKAAAVQETKAP